MYLKFRQRYYLNLIFFCLSKNLPYLCTNRTRQAS
nr:MAG TPA: hypothetical protein [Bacteriophage sp.]